MFNLFLLLKTKTKVIQKKKAIEKPVDKNVSLGCFAVCFFLMLNKNKLIVD